MVELEKPIGAESFAELIKPLFNRAELNMEKVVKSAIEEENYELPSDEHGFGTHLRKFVNGILGK